MFNPTTIYSFKLTEHIIKQNVLLFLYCISKIHKLHIFVDNIFKHCFNCKNNNNELDKSLLTKT